MRKNILLCPLNWGLGHATRCVPIIKALMSQGHKIIIAADKGPLAFLQKYFPELECIEFPGFNPTYSKSNTQVFKMMASFPGALIDFKKDHQTVESIIKNKNIDVIISDNRFGCWSKDVYSVFITHQLHIKVPKMWRWTIPIINIFNNSYIKKIRRDLEGRKDHQTGDENRRDDQYDIDCPERNASPRFFRLRHLLHLSISPVSVSGNRFSKKITSIMPQTARKVKLLKGKSEFCFLFSFPLPVPEGIATFRPFPNVVNLSTK